jgi:hypothetical protein
MHGDLLSELLTSSYYDLNIDGFTNYSNGLLIQSRRSRVVGTEEVMTMRAEEGDETIDELADEAAKTKKELRESTETGAKVQKQQKDAPN